MDLKKNIRERCHVNTNDEGDSFVGVKADTDDAVIYFPIGYQLPSNDDDLRADINNLFYVLAAFMKEDKVIEESKFAAPRTVDFPMHAYLKVIRDYLRTGRYYVETDPRYKTDTKGRASWPRTVREQRALVQKNGSLIFTNILDRNEVYSGCYARVSLNFYAFNSNGNKGVACGLGNIQKIRDGESLGGRSSATDDFSTVADDDFLS